MNPTKIAAAVAAVLLVAGCSSDATGNVADTGSGNIREFHVTVDDGRDVTCLVYAAGYKGGLDCDWGNR